jgi:hypothetical protein
VFTGCGLGDSGGEIHHGHQNYSPELNLCHGSAASQGQSAPRRAIRNGATVERLHAAVQCSTREDDGVLTVGYIRGDGD